MAETDQVFYIAGAIIARPISYRVYRLWLLDQANQPRMLAWKNDTLAVSEKECITLNAGFTHKLPGAQGEIHCLDRQTMEKLKIEPGSRILPDRPHVTALVVGVHEKLWHELSEEDRPLPDHPYRKQGYRLKVVTRKLDSDKMQEFMGFHVEVLPGDSTSMKVRFYDWMNGILGDAEVDLDSPAFDPKSNGHTDINIGASPGTSGALFVSLDEFNGDLKFLSGPKVPYGAGRGRA